MMFLLNVIWTIQNQATFKLNWLITDQNDNIVEFQSNVRFSCFCLLYINCRKKKEKGASNKQKAILTYIISKLNALRCEF